MASGEPDADRASSGQPAPGLADAQGWFPAEAILEERSLGARLAELTTSAVADVPTLHAELDPAAHKPVKADPITVELFGGELLALDALEASAQLVPGLAVHDAGGTSPVIDWLGGRWGEDGQPLVSAAFTFVPTGKGGYKVIADIHDRGERRFSIRPSDDGGHHLWQLDETLIHEDEGDDVGPAPASPPAVDALEPSPAPTTQPLSGGPGEAFGPRSPLSRSAQTVTSVIDVMMAFDNNGWPARFDIQDRLVHHMNSLNLALAVSQMTQRVRLVRLEMVDFTTSGDAVPTSVSSEAIATVCSTTCTRYATP